MNSSFTACVFRKRTLKGVFTGLPAIMTDCSCVALIHSSSAVRQPTALSHERRAEDYWSKRTLDEQVPQPVDACHLSYRATEFLSPFDDEWSNNRFQYTKLKLSGSCLKIEQSQEAPVTITNSGKQERDKAIWFYLILPNPQIEASRNALKGFKRVTLAPGASTKKRFCLLPDELPGVKGEGEKVQQVGNIKISVADSLPGRRSEEPRAVKGVGAMVALN